MRLSNKITAILVSTGLLAGQALAATTNDSVVYEKVDTFSGSVHFTDSFTVTTGGTYQAVFTDFEFTSPFTDSGLNITTATSSLGQLPGPGSVSFDAAPGDYYVSLFASVTGVSEAEKQALIDADEKEKGTAWWKSLSREEKNAQKAMWKTWTEEEMRAHQEKVRKRAERRVEQQLEENIGQYGVQIALMGASAELPVDGSDIAAVPLPAAVWLFATGLVGLAGAGRARRTAVRG